MRTAIVIDDDVDTIDVMSELLEINGVRVVGVGTDGKHAVELYLKLTPNVVLMDVMMPCYDGIYALENIRKINPDSKVIMITGDATESTMDRLVDLKPSAVFYKPMDMGRVIQAINDMALPQAESVR